MKVGKIPVASIVLFVIAFTRIIMNRVYPGQYTSESSFVTGMFFGAGVIYLLYYVNVYYTAWMNSKAENKTEANNSSL